MTDTRLLEILCCPATRQALRLASADELSSVNSAIATGNCRTKAGESISESLTEALVTTDGKIMYPVRQDIPVMLVDESILLA